MEKEDQREENEMGGGRGDCGDGSPPLRFQAVTRSKDPETQANAPQA